MLSFRVSGCNFRLQHHTSHRHPAAAGRRESPTPPAAGQAPANLHDARTYTRHGKKTGTRPERQRKEELQRKQERREGNEPQNPNSHAHVVRAAGGPLDGGGGGLDGGRGERATNKKTV